MRRLIPLVLMGFLALYLERSLLSPLWEVTRLGYGLLLAIFLFGFSAQLWLFFVFFQAAADTPLLGEPFLKSSAFHSMGGMSLLITFTLIRDLARLPGAWAGSESAFPEWTSSVGVLMVSALLYVHGFRKARYRTLTRTVPIRAPLPLRIVQLSDMHLGTGPGVEAIRSQVERVLELNPDLVVLTGDIIDGEMNLIQGELQELARLRAPHGVYFVLGNHECYWDHERSLSALRKIGILPLLNEGSTLRIGDKNLFLAGVTDPALQGWGGPGPRLPAIPEDSHFKVLLAHQPGISRLASEAGYDLQLSGHTHGGQFFPWNFLVRWIHPHHGGLSREGDLQIYVSHGTGYWGPPLRIGTHSEITELVLGGGVSS